MVTDALLTIQLAIGLVFSVSGLTKMFAFRAFQHGLVDYKLIPRRWLGVTAITIVVIEILVGLSHLTSWQIMAASGAATVFISVLVLVVAIALRSGRAVSCLCFGAGTEVVSMQTLIRSLLLLTAEGILYGSLRLGFVRSTPIDGKQFIGALIGALLLLSVVGLFLALQDVTGVLKRRSSAKAPQ